MGVLQRIIETAQAAPKRIVLCEAQDPRVLQAAVRAQQERIARIVMVGNPAQSVAIASQHGLDISNIIFTDPATSEARERYAQQLYRLREKKGMTLQQAQLAVTQPLCFANLMLHMGDADGSVAGAVHTTADVVRTALQIVGAKASAGSIVSSFFLMIFEHEHHPTKGGMIFSDCGLVIDPDAQQLARIALDSAKSASALLGEAPRIAMLSFSTLGSAQHVNVTKVQQATQLVRQARPDLLIDGEVQLDAAIIPDIASRKLSDSQVHGRANVLIFPDLNAGNIGYKLAERLGGAVAIGPLLQGLNKPANDLSRGCNADDVYNVIAVTCVQAQQLQAQATSGELTSVPAGQ
ncbi:phosphate acetyltransferase [Advenella mimigardefordensis]|uniref:Phosphate acetyltransferase n=1 Tax=Advenella mimigardefordensis (strain DSM 17166 / LMG 22922 / DPN7) TaxID=1247726 RepID=W0PGY4_ADVMD|nr:phosphate acetyltransferase [Advenella mimigardefordensis]AHG65716.1 phosphate acetyltransferase [Advenella mimigardefordensis DPN7]